ASLRTALFYVRDALGSDSESVLSITREHVSVRERAPLHLDVDDLTHAQRLLRGAAGVASAKDRISDAVDGYRGPFLAGVAFSDAPDFEAWLELQRTRWLGVTSELLGEMASSRAPRVAGRRGSARRSQCRPGAPTRT